MVTPAELHMDDALLFPHSTLPLPQHTLFFITGTLVTTYDAKLGIGAVGYETYYRSVVSWSIIIQIIFIYQMIFK
jgi:hypothetical protein